MFDFLKRKKKADAAGAPKPLPFSSLKQSLRSLEPRLMFDAAAAATAAEVASEHVAQEQADAAVSTEASHETTSAETAESEDVLKALATFMPAEARTEVVFVDPTVPNYQELLASMDPNTEVIMLDAGKDGVQQIADSLAGRTGVDAIHLISHGNAGELQLGTGHLTQESMTDRYASELAVIKGSLSEQADLLIYGCKFAEGEQGERAATTLADLTGTDVQASVDLTGSASKGGDWDFEFKVGQIETSLAIGQVAQENWVEILRGEEGEDAHAGSDKDSKDPDHREHKESKDRGDREGKEGKDTKDHGDGHKESKAWGDRNREDGERGHKNSAPTITSDGGKDSATLHVHENTAFVTKVTAKDLDAGQALEFRIVGGADASKFAIDQTTGELRFSTAPNYEMPGDRGADNVYHVKVQVSDGFGKKDTQKIKVIVADVNEGPRNLTMSAHTVAENAVSGTVAETVKGADAFAEDTKSSSLTDAADGRVAINARMGGITVGDGSLLNYESALSRSETVRVPDSRGATDEETFTSTPANVNEGPEAVALSVNTVVAENAANGTVVGTASTADPEAGDTHTDQRTSDAGGRVAINRSAGQIAVADGALLSDESRPGQAGAIAPTDAAEAQPRQGLPGSLGSTVATSGSGKSEPLLSLSRAPNEIAGEEIGPPDGFRGATAIGIVPPLEGEQASPDRAPTQSGSLEDRDGLLEHSGGEELLAHFSSRSGDSERTQGQIGPTSTRMEDGRQVDAKESERGPVQDEAAEKTAGGMAEGIAGSILQDELVPKGKSAILRSPLHGNGPASPAGHGGGPHGHDLDGQESPSRHGSEPGERRSP